MSRISGKTDVYKLSIELDVNTDIFPMHKGVSYALVLANWLSNEDQDYDLFEAQNQAAGGYPGQDKAGQGSNLIDQY